MQVLTTAPHISPRSDLGKDPRVAPLLAAVVGDDPDAGDLEFGSGDTLTLFFDRPTNISTDLIGGVQPREYVDSVMSVSEPLGIEYDGRWLDTSTFRVHVRDGYLPAPQINDTFDATTRFWLADNAPLRSANRLDLVAPRTASQALRIRGSLGTHAKPRLLWVNGSDPDNGDFIYSDRDILTFKFNMPTYIGRQGSRGNDDPFRPRTAGATGLRYDAAAIHALFEFDYFAPNEAAIRVPSFGRNYEGYWTDDSTFVMTVLDRTARIGTDSRGRLWNRMPVINSDAYMGLDGKYMTRDSIWVRVLGDVRSLGRQSPRCDDRVPLTGDWGERQQAPRVVSYSGTDPDNSDSVPSAGDTIRILFDRKTSRGLTARPPPPQEGTMAYANFFLAFTPSIGDLYTARFLPDNMTLVVTILSGNPSWTHEVFGVPSKMRIKPESQIRSSFGASDPVNRELVLGQTFFGKPGPPVFESATVSDYDNFNTAWSGGDVIRMVFDRSTDDGRRGVSGGRAYIDSIFETDHHLGNEYTGQWEDTSTFAVTAVNTQTTRPTVGLTRVRTSRMFLNRAATATCCSVCAPGSQQVRCADAFASQDPFAREATVSGRFGGRLAPQLISFRAVDACGPVPTSPTEVIPLTPTMQAVYGGSPVSTA